MSADKDQKVDAKDQALEAEIDRTMAEAEAAVTALESDTDATLDDRAEARSEAARITELEAELASAKDRWLRAVADLENYKKRVKREKEEDYRRTVQKLVPGFLPVMDNLERALEIAEPAARTAPPEQAKAMEQVVAGLRIVASDFMNTLTKNGIETVPSVGLPFDPSLHDALQQVDSPDHAPGIVIREFERGYRLGDRLLRPARVIIAGAGSTGGTRVESEN